MSLDIVSTTTVEDYTIIDGHDPLGLEQCVREMLHDDWVPWGGAFFAHVPDQTGGMASPRFCQAMVKVQSVTSLPVPGIPSE